MSARFLVPFLVLTLCGCGRLELPFPSADKEESPCGPANCDGCCLLGACVEQASRCGGAACDSCAEGGSSSGKNAPRAAPGAACVGLRCASGTECMLVRNLYWEARCWEPCADGKTCRSGFDCADTAVPGQRACIPSTSPAAVWELRRESLTIPPTRADGSRWPTQNFQLCFSFDGRTACEASSDARAQPVARFHASEVGLSRVAVDLWILDPNLTVPACEGQACDVQQPLHSRRAAATPSPADLRAPSGAKTAVTDVGLSEGVKVKLRVERVR